MGKSITELLNEAEKLSEAIYSFLISSTYDQCYDLSGLSVDREDPEELLLLDEMRGIVQSLDDAYRVIQYLTLPIESISTLHLNPGGRYESEDGYVYTSGTPIEAMIEDDKREVPYWALSRIESDANGYYIMYHRGALKDGIKVRRRCKSRSQIMNEL